MSYDGNVTRHPTTVEYGKFVEIVGDARFPAVSVTRVEYPESVSMSPISTIETYPKYAVLTHLVNASDINISLNSSSVNIGDVGIIDHSTGSTVYAKVTQTDTIGGVPVGAISVTSTNPTSAVIVNNTVAVSASRTLPVSGSVTVLNPVTSLSATILNPIRVSDVVSVSTSQTIPVSGRVTATMSGAVEVVYADNGTLDAFGKLRVSFPTTLFDSKTLHNKASLFWSQITSGTGSAVVFTSESLDASVTLSTADVGSYAIRQTNQRFNYQPAKSQIALFTGVVAPVSNAIKRYGLFQSLTAAPYTPTVGLFFETQTDSPSSIAVVQLNVGGLVPSVSARRENWNIDKLDGTGPSGKILSLSAANIFLIDYEWLGVGRVRYGTVIDGKICYCHEINNAGGVHGAYIRTPNLPVRAELRQTQSGVASMKMICCSVQSEGGADFTGVVKSVDSGVSALTVAAGVRRAIVGVRLQPLKLDSVNEVLNASAIALASNNQYACYKYEIVINPTITLADGAVGTWYADANSNYENWQWNGVGTQTITGGTAIVMGYSSVGSSIDLSGFRFEKFLKLGCTVDGVRDALYLVITPLQDNQGVLGSITFVESD